LEYGVLDLLVLLLVSSSLEFLFGAVPVTFSSLALSLGITLVHLLPTRLSVSPFLIHYLLFAPSRLSLELISLKIEVRLLENSMKGENIVLIGTASCIDRIRVVCCLPLPPPGSLFIFLRHRERV
jgi:hypothetical protein